MQQRAEPFLALLQGNALIGIPVNDERRCLHLRCVVKGRELPVVIEVFEEVPAEIARYLRDANLPATLRMGNDPRLAVMPWGETALELAHGASDGHDLNGASAAFAGVAETGTLALCSGPDNPTTINFLPDNHIVVVFAGDIVADYESVWNNLRARCGKGAMPRTLNFITGPSRSADIEQTLLLGAHGPRRLHIVMVREG